MFRVIVAGGRDYDDYDKMKESLDYFFQNKKPTSIVCGEAKGADKLGRKYAEENGIQVDSFPADWENEGKSAGYKRNERMSKNADALVAYWDGESRGTANMIELMKNMGKPVKIVYYEGAVA